MPMGPEEKQRSHQHEWGDQMLGRFLARSSDLKYFNVLLPQEPAILAALHV